MKEKNLKRYYILEAIVLAVIATFILFNINKNSDPFEVIRKRHLLEDHELIYIDETKGGVLVYSVGKENKGKDNMYYVDMVKKSLGSYKWVGGGGHVNRFIPDDNREFIFSAQLLNESPKITPTLFGIIRDKDVSNISIRNQQGLSYATIYDGKDKDERIYVVSFENNVSELNFFLFTLIYKDGKELEFIINKDINRFKKGYNRFFFENDIKIN
ncbi:hypothetical protein [Alkaliphilus sp. B6464]|uniref:hypothetical protein n=1 Tax=Alkaliphilus sp. B6464 TaxID=2731219 RepID=UPI001BA46D6B|nr:hypothetical protein [Alkaliphilus sp. B6464]QUH21231.1 hypothetical protein HYG84_15970 [Alkaliphilus sp. B6464]